MKWPTMDEFAQMVADKAIDEVEFNGKTIREWTEIILATELGTDCISRQQVIDALRGYLVGKRCPDDGTLTCRLIENEVINKLPPAEPEIHHCIDCILYNKPECLMAFENACWAEPYGYCHMFTGDETNDD